MLHYSLTTKKTRQSLREELDNKALDPLRRLAHYGGRLPRPRERFSLRLTHVDGGAVFTLMHGRDAVMATGLAWDPPGEQVVWKSLKNLTVFLGEESVYGITPKGRPVPPERLPWTASVALPGWHKHEEQQLAWVESFEEHGLGDLGDAREEGGELRFGC
jgi:hypothetical protein